MSDKNSDSNLPSTKTNSGRVELHDNGVRASNLVDHAISQLKPEQMQALGMKAGEEHIRLQARQSQQNIDYVTGKKVVEDHLQAWDMVNKNGRTTRQSITTDVETGAGKMRIESKSGATCFVATAAYGDPQHPDVVWLRWYRDHVLNQTRAGRSFTDWYWRVGPRIAKVVAPSPWLRATARQSLAIVVHFLQQRHRNRHGS